MDMNSGHHATSQKATNCDTIQSIKSEKTRNRFLFFKITSYCPDDITPKRAPSSYGEAHLCGVAPGQHTFELRRNIAAVASR